MTKLTGLLVGMHFHPPAKLLLEHLPNGTPVILRSEPENPYDEDAVQVFLDAKHIPEGQHAELAAKLPGMGMVLSEVLAQEDGPWVLGHLAKSDGKPLEKARIWKGDLVGNLDFLRGGITEGRLVFDGTGMVGVEGEEAGE